MDSHIFGIFHSSLWVLSLACELKEWRMFRRKKRWLIYLFACATIRNFDVKHAWILKRNSPHFHLQTWKVATISKLHFSFYSFCNILWSWNLILFSLLLHTYTKKAIPFDPIWFHVCISSTVEIFFKVIFISHPISYMFESLCYIFPKLFHIENFFHHKRLEKLEQFNLIFERVSSILFFIIFHIQKVDRQSLVRKSLFT